MASAYYSPGVGGVCVCADVLGMCTLDSAYYSPGVGGVCVSADVLGIHYGQCLLLTWCGWVLCMCRCFRYSLWLVLTTHLVWVGFVYVQMF